MNLPDTLTSTIQTFLKEQHIFSIRKIKSFKTAEGRFSVYDVSEDIRHRPDMFTVFEDPQGWIIRNAFVPEALQRKGVATAFYIEINKRSQQKTGKNLRSTQPKKLLSGEIVHELSEAGVLFWDSLVSRGLAKKINEKNYIFL